MRILCEKWKGGKGRVGRVGKKRGKEKGCVTAVGGMDASGYRRL